MPFFILARREATDGLRRDALGSTRSQLVALRSLLVAHSRTIVAHHTRNTKREMKTTQSYAFYCRTSKANRDGLAPIELGINISGRRVFMNLPRKERPRDFEHPNDDLKCYLSAMRLRLNEIITEITINGLPVTADTIREYLRFGGRKSHTVKRLLEESLSKVKETAKSYGSYQKYEQVARMFESVLDPMREAVTLSPSDIHAYEGLLRGYKPSTKGVMLTKLKTLLRYGLQEGILKADPFRNTKISRPAPDIVYLTDGELEKLRTAKLYNESLERVRDVALFQASSGLAYIDLKDLKPEDMHCTEDGKYYISKERHKTGVRFVAPIIDGGEKIFFMYQGHLPVLTNEKYNAYVKAIADLSGISADKNLTTHVFRRTYATRLVSKGVRVETTAKALGHTDLKITLRHYACLREDVIIDEVSKAFGGK